MQAHKSRFRAGDPVRISNRESTPQDLKSCLFYNHFRGLAGTVQKIYGTEAAIEVDEEALPDDIRGRHRDIRDQMRDRWLEGLPLDIRRKLTPEQKQFNLRYVVLVGIGDIEKRRTTRSRAGAADGARN